MDIVLAGQLERLSKRLLVQVKGDGPFAVHRIGDAGPHSLVDKGTDQGIATLDGRQPVAARPKVGFLKFPGDRDPGVDLGLLSLLEGDQIQV